jgi:hypothetical protein
MNAWATGLRCAEPRFPSPKPKRKTDSRWVKCEGSLIPPALGTCPRRAPAGPLTATGPVCGGTQRDRRAQINRGFALGKPRTGTGQYGLGRTRANS